MGCEEMDIFLIGTGQFPSHLNGFGDEMSRGIFGKSIGRRLGGGRGAGFTFSGAFILTLAVDLGRGLLTVSVSGFGRGLGVGGHETGLILFSDGRYGISSFILFLQATVLLNFLPGLASNGRGLIKYYR